MLILTRVLKNTRHPEEYQVDNMMKKLNYSWNSVFKRLKPQTKERLLKTEGERHRETELDSNRDRLRQRQVQRKTEIGRDRDRDRQRDRVRQGQTDRSRGQRERFIRLSRQAGQSE